MMRLMAVTLLANVLFGWIVAAVSAEPAPEQDSPLAARQTEVTADQVRQAIEHGVRYLKSQQQDDGTWREWPGPPAQPGGINCLCTLALLNAGVEPSDPSIQKALGTIRKLKPVATYATALATMVLARAEPKKDASQITVNVRWLEATQITDGRNRGAWSYPVGDGDNSNSQFALLALYEAERANVGVAVNARTWRLANDYWEADQNDDGSWSYPCKIKIANASSGSMTCAGITSLVIAADRIRPSDAKVEGDHIECCVGHASDEQDRIEKGLRWLQRHFSVASNPGSYGRIFTLYYLYGLERAGRLTARRFIGDHDWYREGAEYLVRQQETLSGFWRGAGPEMDPLIGTSFALLFLSKGRWPVLLGKVKHTSDEDWNQHRGDVNNLTRYVESRWKRDLTWQVADIGQSSVEDLLQTPVLYWCASKSPLPNTREQREKLARKLRDYVDRGGFLFAEGNCGEGGFDKGFRELMALVFPEPEYKLRLLEREHPIWYAEEKVDAQYLRELWGIDFGCRTSVVYAPLHLPQEPLSCLWELSRPGREEKYGAAVQAKIKAALSIGLNVLAYATNRELRTKDDLFRPKTDMSSNRSVERGRLQIAKLRHPGGCNAAPRALANLLEAAGRELKVRTRVRDELLDLTDDALFNYPMVFMDGRSSFHFTDAERQQLKTYLERGGVLLADSVCASPAFTESFRREMAAIFPDRKLERIPAEDPVWTKKYGGFDLKTVSRRDPATRKSPDGPLEAKVQTGPPDLEGIKFQDRWGVVFSPFDLSCALEKQDSPECRGYLREDAARIGLNVLLYSMQQ